MSAQCRGQLDGLLETRIFYYLYLFVGFEDYWAFAEGVLCIDWFDWALDEQFAGRHDPRVAFLIDREVSLLRLHQINLSSAIIIQNAKLYQLDPQLKHYNKLSMLWSINNAYNSLIYDKGVYLAKFAWARRDTDKQALDSKIKIGDPPP